MLSATATTEPTNRVSSLTVTEPRKRLLLLTHRFPYPPNRGDRIRSYNLMRVLAESFDVTLACPHDEPVSQEDLDHVKQICAKVVTEPVGVSRWCRAGVSLLGGHSLTEGLFHSPALADQIRTQHRARPFDLALVFCSSMFPYIDGLEFSSVRVVTDLVDVDSEKWRQMSCEANWPKRAIYRTEANRVRELEKRVADHSESVVLVSESEADVFRSVVDAKSLAVGVSNGVDTDYFQPASDRNDTHPVRLVFTGVLDYPPNVEGMQWFCSNVVPELRKQLDFELQIVGRRPVSVVKQLGRIEGVQVVGEVPDVRPYLHQANIAISPLHLARGIQNKVLEAMACGLPVVTTSQSAEGINATDGEEFFIADDFEDWVSVLCWLAADSKLRKQVGTNARDLVVKEYGWSARMQKIVEILKSIDT